MEMRFIMPMLRSSSEERSRAFWAVIFLTLLSRSV